MNLSFKKKSDKKTPLKVVKLTKFKRRTLLISFLWGFLVLSVVIGVVNNFNSARIIEKQTETVIKEKSVDVSGIATFVSNYTRTFFTWDTSTESKTARSEALARYLPDELVKTASTNLANVQTKSAVTNVEIWNIEDLGGNQYRVLLTVYEVVGDKKQEMSYTLTVYRSKTADSFVVSKNFTVAPKPGKAEFAPEKVTTSTVVDPKEREKITEFLTTFYTIYPTISEKELVYYVNDPTVKALSVPYEFKEIKNLVLIAEKNNSVQATFTVDYLNTVTKLIESNDYTVLLHVQNTNYVIGEMR